MQWGQEDQEHELAGESEYLLELAAFLSARSGGGPAILWTDYEPPATDDPFMAQDTATLAARLSALLNRTVRALPQDPEDPHTSPMGQAQSELVVLQLFSATDILVGAPTDSTDVHRVPLAVRLRGGQALFVPCRSTCTLRPEPGSRHAVLQISTPRVSAYS
ncbi:hypothetical protein [Streptomyces sp. NPDC048496]|uniref:hypothetical protein n=1 Tax=Streptomyces sp. NPDC048496 TaxID=3365558 RepID=UPI0037242720